MNQLERHLGLEFKDKGLLEQALTHRSYVNENPDWPYPDNERLEYLGDALLNFLTADYLWQRFPEYGEGELTALRSSLVQTSTLANLAVQLGVGEYLHLGHGEEATGGRERPTILCAAFEAIVGAIYLDQGLEMTRHVLWPHLHSLIGDLLSAEAYKDAKTQLQELVQATLHLTPTYRTLHEVGPDHAKQFTVAVYVGDEQWGVGLGSSKAAAEQAAARVALARATEFGRKERRQPSCI
ncbi:MAG: ribonuclease III [Chloroflexi bacterium]|nr:ribonuclease III [Chloroflexota bacterium]